jgi:hypothetical protein
MDEEGGRGGMIMRPMACMTFNEKKKTLKNPGTESCRAS